MVSDNRKAYESIGLSQADEKDFPAVEINEYHEIGIWHVLESLKPSDPQKTK